VSRATATPARLHVAWSVPAALGALVAASLTTAAPPLVGAGAVLGWSLAIGLVAVVARALSAPALGRALLAAGLAFGVTGAHGLAWSHAADPWSPSLGTSLRVEGTVDGRRLIVPGRPALLLRGAALPNGRVVVDGLLEPLAERRNPGGFDEAGFWRRRGVRAALRVERRHAYAEPSGLLAARAALQSGVTEGLPPRVAALQQALTLGIRHDLGELRALFAAAGMAHVLALSGLHVGVLAGAVALTVRPLGRRRGGLAVLLVVAAYVALVGPSPSVVRAAIMVAVLVVARAAELPSAPLGASLAAAALACLLVAPAWVGDLGFVLSFASVAGIVLLAGPVLRWSRTPPRAGAYPARAWRGAVRWTMAALATSGAAQAATASVVAGGFGAVPLAAPLVNLVAVPLASFLVPLGALAGLAGVVQPALAAAVNALVRPLAEALLAVAEGAARLPSLPWGAIGSDGHALAGLALTAVALALHGAVRWRSALLVVVAASALAWGLPDRHGVPEAIVLDVGQGDAVVVRLGGGAAILVDTGGVTFGGTDLGERVVVPALRALGVWRLPLVVATHPDLDHIGGMPAVLEAFAVGEVWVGHPEPERPAWQAVERSALRRGVPIREVRRGEHVEIGSLRVDVLHPTASPIGEGNADSVALLLRYRGAPWMLLLGDVPVEVERDLPVPPTPVLLAPHHGSSTSTGADLLRAARPRIVLISVGRNRYGHPAADVLARLETAGVPAVATRDHGALRAHPARACVRTELSRPGAGVPGTC
jgi:competence protein ComEC